jgi:Domain of unknown function (DUF397)
MMGHRYRKSKFSGGNGACVAVAFLLNGVRVRDTKDPGGPDLFFTNEEWTAFIKGVRHGEFDLPSYRG